MNDDFPDGPDIPAEAVAAQRMLTAFLVPGANVRALSAQLQPKPEDYAAVFRGDLADGMRRIYEGLWTNNPVITRKQHQSGLIVRACPAEAFVAGNPLMRAFPGGYAGLADVFVPGRIWIAWKFVEAGQRLGMAYDGLVNIDSRWVWFPKPYMVVERLTTA